MHTLRVQLGPIALLLLGSSACSWSRFDDITNNAPNVLLSKPKSFKSGFGTSLATANTAGKTSVLVGGTASVSGAALYDIGEEDAPGTSAVDSGFCAGSDDPCYLSSSLAGFATARGPDQERSQCFAVGTGSLGTLGIVMRCKDSYEYTLKIPKTAQKLLSFSIMNQQPYDYPLAVDHTENPVLLATLPYQQAAWFYPAQSIEPVELSLPATLSDDPSFGTTSSVVSVGSGRVLAIGVPGKSEVLLWRTDGAASASYIGCLGGINGLGRALASGNVNADADADLVVSDESKVTVIDGRALFDLPEVSTDSRACDFSLLPTSAVLGSFGCDVNGSLSGCSSSEFGAALAVGDLDGDGDGELIVGAPRMQVRDEAAAGALLVFDADSPAETSYVDAKFLSSAESNDALGASLATAHISGRDIVVAGAPGNGKVALFYCSTLLAPGSAGPRCP